MGSAVERRGARRHGVWGALGWVAAGSMAANIAAYVVYVGASQWLGPADFGQFARLLSAMLVLGVPALAVQSVIAREVVHGIDPLRVRVLTGQTTAMVAAALVVAVPAVVVVLRVGADAAFAALCTAPLLVVIAGAQGVLQGWGEFRALAWSLAITGLVRTLPVVVALTLGATPATALWAGTAGAALAAVLAWAAVTVTTRADAGRASQFTPLSGPREVSRHATLGGVRRASQVQLVLVVAISIDLLLSATVLDEAAAGVYALGAIATKAAFWLPQATGVVFYPRLADAAGSRTSLRQAVRVVAGIGVALTVLAAVGGAMIPVVFGEQYRRLVPIAWLFTYTGSAMAVLQVLLLAAIAANRTRVARFTWLVMAVETIVIVTVVHSVAALAASAAVAVTVAAALTGLSAMRAVADSPDDSR